MQLDDHLKNLLRELGHAINDTVSDSDRITGAIAGVRAHGYDIVLKLDATIGLAKRTPEPPETALLSWRGSRAACGRGHTSILAQIAADIRKPSRIATRFGPWDLNQGTVDGLETTE